MYINKQIDRSTDGLVFISIYPASMMCINMYERVIHSRMQFVQKARTKSLNNCISVYVTPSPPMTAIALIKISTRQTTQATQLPTPLRVRGGL